MNRPTKLCVSARLASYEKMYPKSGAILPTIKAVSGSCVAEAMQRQDGRRMRNSKGHSVA